MNDKGMSQDQKSNKRFGWFKGAQYWIAAVCYVIILSLSLLCLIVYLPDLTGSEVLDSGSYVLLEVILIVVLISATAFFGWETVQWRRKRAPKKQQSSLEDIIKSAEKDSNKNT